MKKVMIMLAIAIFAFTIAPQKVHAEYAKSGSLGFALTGGYAGGGAFGGVITFQIPKIPLMFGVSGGIWGDGFNLNLSGDWWGLNPRLGSLGTADVYFYFGPGAYLGLGVYKEFLGFNLGIRAPIGFSFLVEKSRKWEVYIELAPGINLIDAWNKNRDTSWVYFVGSSRLGFRYWF